MRNDVSSPRPVVAVISPKTVAALFPLVYFVRCVWCHLVHHVVTQITYLIDERLCRNEAFCEDPLRLFEGEFHFATFKLFVMDFPQSLNGPVDSFPIRIHPERA
jgi:hypothetical protein